MSAVFVLHPNVGLGVGILFSRVISVLRLDLMRSQRLVTTEQYTIDTIFYNFSFIISGFLELCLLDVSDRALKHH